MKLFNIYSMQDDNYRCIIFINAHITPFEIIDAISSELNDKSIGDGKILFDLLLYRGNGSKRYFVANFTNKRFENGSFKPINISKRSYIRKVSTFYFKENFDLLTYSMLTDPQRKLISKGLVI